jgi:hypothetical protein
MSYVPTPWAVCIIEPSGGGSSTSGAVAANPMPPEKEASRPPAV